MSLLAPWTRHRLMVLSKPAGNPHTSAPALWPSASGSSAPAHPLTTLLSRPASRTGGGVLGPPISLGSCLLIAASGHTLPPGAQCRVDPKSGFLLIVSLLGRPQAQCQLPLEGKKGAAGNTPSPRWAVLCAACLYLQLQGTAPPKSCLSSRRQGISCVSEPQTASDISVLPPFSFPPFLPFFLPSFLPSFLLPSVLPSSLLSFLLYSHSPFLAPSLLLVFSKRPSASLWGRHSGHKEPGFYSHAALILWAYPPGPASLSGPIW